MHRTIWLLCLLALLIVPCQAQDEAGLKGELKDAAKKSVDLGLKYLARKVNADGSWNDPTGKPHPGITAMVLSAFLRSHRGYTDADLPFLRKGIDYLLGMQKEDGGIYDKDLQNYVTAVSLMALADAKRSFENPAKVAEITEAIDRAKKYLIDLQADEGEGYEASDKFFGGVGYGGDLRPDISNTQLAMEALSEAGLPKDHPFFEKAVKFLERCQNRSESNDQPWAGTDGGFVYYPGKSYAGEYDRPDGSKGLRSYGSMSYAGLKSYIHAGLAADDPRVKSAYDWITQNYTVDENPGTGGQGLYYYYHTFAKTFHILGIEEVEDADGEVHLWRADLARKLAAEQETGEGDDYGSWINASDRWWEGDRVLATTYAVLALNHVLD